MTCVKEKMYFFICFLIIQESNSWNMFVQQDNTIQSVSLAKCIAAFANRNIGKLTIAIINENRIDYNINVQETAKIFAEEYVPQIIITESENSNVINKLENVLLLVFTDIHRISSVVNKVHYEMKYLIVVNEAFGEKSFKALQKIASKLQHHDATFIINDLRNATYTFLTTVPEIDRNSCNYDDEVKSMPINTCINGVLTKDTIFPAKKPTNLQNCPFNVGMATMYPYSMIDNKETLQNLQPINESQIRGSDLQIIRIISNYFNASLKLYYIYREEENPFLNLEYIPFLLNGTFDACAGGLYRIYGDLVYYSGIYTRQAVVWVYSVQRDPVSWQTLVTKINGLYIFILFYFCYCVIWIVFSNFDHISVSCRNTFLNGWGALMGTSSLQDSITLKQKILSVSYLILCLHLSAYISVQLYSFFTIREPPAMLRTNDEIMESGRTAFLRIETKFFVEDDKYVAFANKSENCAHFKDCEDKTVAHNGLTVIPEGYFYSLQAATTVDYEARVLRPSENIITMYHEMIVRKNSTFSVKFENIVQSLFEAGICDRLYLEAIGLLISAKAQSANSNIMANSYTCESGCAITVSQIAGAFYVWFTGCLVSFFVFVLEVTMNNKLK